MNNKLLEKFDWRYATKVFDKDKKIPENDLQTLLDALVLTSSSFWLQPWKFILVENKKLREELLPYSWNQNQIVDASHLLVFARVDDNYEKLIDSYLDKIVEKRWWTRENLKGYEDMMKGFAWWKWDEGMKKWADEQVFIALGNAMTVLAEMKIDSCAIWWFDPVKYDEILGLKEKGLASVVVLPIWYRDEEADKYAKLPKVRFEKDDLVIKY